jgi:ribosomal protein L37E
MGTEWVEECMAKQRSEIAVCDRCGKTTGRRHCSECGACGTSITKRPMLHAEHCSRRID